MKVKIAFILLFLSSLTGCVSTSSETLLKRMYNVPSSGLSQFDESKYIRLSNMQCNSIIFELYQDTQKSKNSVVLLKAGVSSIANVASGESLLIKIDGEIHTLKSNDSFTEHGTIYFPHGVNVPFSHKTYIVPESLVRAVASSNVFLSKLHLLNNTFEEGKCSNTSLEEARENNKGLGLEITQKDVDTANKITAANGFRKFVEMIDSTSW